MAEKFDDTYNHLDTISALNTQVAGHIDRNAISRSRFAC